MNIDRLIHSLEKNGDLIVRFFSDLGEDQARWKETPRRWSLLEILSHLLDEERSDFRVRLELTLRDPTLEWPAVDPERWAVERKYNSMDINNTLVEFRQEREKSLAWLRELGDVKWENAKVHPSLGTLQAGDFLVSWAAHDLLHLRQAVNTALALQIQLADPYSTGYAIP